MTLLATVYVLNTWPATAAVTDPGCTSYTVDPPVRILESRDVVTEPAGPNVGLAGPFRSGIPQKLQVSGNITLGASGTKTVVPSSATSISFNVTIVNNTQGGFVSLRPGDATGAPGTSSENFGPSSPGSNNAGEVGLSGDGKIDIYYGAAGDTSGLYSTDLIIDVVGYCDGSAIAAMQAQIDKNAADILALQPTPPTTTPTPPTTTGTPPTIAVKTYKVEFRGSVAGKTSTDDWDLVRFKVDAGVVTGTVGDDGNASNGKSSLARPGEVGKGTNEIKVTIAGGFTDPDNPTSVGSIWRFYNLEYNSSTGIIKGIYTRLDGTSGDTGIFQMYDNSGTKPSPLPAASLPPEVPATDGSTCTTGTEFDYSVASYEIDFSGTIPGVAPFESKFNVRFSAADGTVAGSSVKHDGTDPPYTLPSGKVVCGNRTMTVQYDQSDPPAGSIDVTYTLFNIEKLGTASFSGNYKSDKTSPSDVGTFTMTKK